MTQICKLQTKPYSIFDDLFTDINFFRFPSIDTSTNNIRPVYDIIENDNDHYISLFIVTDGHGAQQSALVPKVKKRKFVFQCISAHRIADFVGGFRL